MASDTKHVRELYHPTRVLFCKTLDWKMKELSHAISTFVLSSGNTVENFSLLSRELELTDHPELSTVVNRGIEKLLKAKEFMSSVVMDQQKYITGLTEKYYWETILESFKMSKFNIYILQLNPNPTETLLEMMKGENRFTIGYVKTVLTELGFGDQAKILDQKPF